MPSECLFHGLEDKPEIMEMTHEQKNFFDTCDYDFNLEESPKRRFKKLHAKKNYQV
jgi:hypothetical protein